MRLISISPWKKATDLRGKIIYIRTITEQTKSGKVYTRREAIRQKLTA